MQEALQAAQVTPFWGHPTSSIDWCEDNYTTSSYVAE
jgi:hypothetical protein